MALSLLFLMFLHLSFFYVNIVSIIYLSSSSKNSQHDAYAGVELANTVFLVSF